MNETLGTWLEQFANAVDRMKDPFGALRGLGVIPPPGDDPAGRLESLASTWLQVVGLGSVTDCVTSIGNRLGGHHNSELDVLAGWLRGLEAEIARLLDAQGANFANCGLLPTKWCTAYGLLRHANSVGDGSFFYIVGLQELPEAHWLRSMAVEFDLGMSLVAGECEKREVIGHRPRPFYPLGPAIAFTQHRRALEREEADRIRRDGELMAMRNQQRDAQLSRPATAAEFEQLQVENRKLREQLAGNDTQR